MIMQKFKTGCIDSLNTHFIYIFLNHATIDFIQINFKKYNNTKRAHLTESITKLVLSTENKVPLPEDTTDEGRIES